MQAGKKISDRGYQELSWFGQGAVMSSPEELYCGLVDDLLFDEFLSQSASVLTDKQREAGLALKAEMDAYFASVGELPDPFRVFSDPDWEKVRERACDFVAQMSA